MNRSLTPRDNLLKVFRHEQPAWIPVHIGHIGPGELPEDFRNGMDTELDAVLGSIQWCDGSARILDDYLGIDVTKMDAVDALNLAPPYGKGDVPTLAEAFERLGPNIVILKGLELTHRGSDADCAAAIAQVFRDAGPGRNIIFSAKGPNIARTQFVAGECRKHQQMYAHLHK